MKKNIREDCKNNKLKVIVPTGNDDFELPGFPYSGSNIHSRLYRVCHKEHKVLSDNPPIHIYVNRYNNRLVFKIKDGYKHE